MFSFAIPKKMPDVRDINLDLLTGENHDLIVDLACRYARSRDSVDPSWRLFFDRMGRDVEELVVEARRDPRFQHHFAAAASQSDGRSVLRLKVERLVAAFRDRGHASAQLDALDPSARTLSADLGLAAHGIDAEGVLDGGEAGPTGRTDAIHSRLVDVYCGTLALEAAHVLEDERRQWLYDAFEGADFAPSALDRMAVFSDLVRAETLEDFLHRKHPSIKRFGAEGAEALVPLSNTILSSAAAAGVERVVIGGMHRGRLNMLAHVVGKPLDRIFAGFLDLPQQEEREGFQHDVLYHLGNDAQVAFGDRTLSISLLPHPSHLIAVSAVALGRARAEQDERTDGVARVLPLMMHTDAAFAGQGLSSEILQLTGIDGFGVGGAIHIVANNRLGFTTSEEEGRRTPYCTDIAKAYGIPVLRVNGSDPDAVWRCGRIAAAYRQRFRSDIMIDFVCYRRRGHNELDEPAFTQPLIYRRMAEQVPVCAAYETRLQADGIDVSQAGMLRQAHERKLLTAYEQAQTGGSNAIEWLAGKWSNVRPSSETEDVRTHTAVPLQRLIDLGNRLAVLPEGKALHKGFMRFQQARAESMKTDGRVNWATAEALAFASLLEEGYRVRLTGQDVVRGTFTQRHLRWTDQETGETGGVFDRLDGGSDRFTAINSPLMEYGVVGFEYGYSLSSPDCLSIWEAQFGDFGNVAQPIIDQFIVCGEQKWNRLSGLVLSLPHGLEGGGPDHSTGRPERFLAACAAGNLTVANCTTPANYFHILRRQMRWPYRRPLVIFSPKAHLRTDVARSALTDLAEGSAFQSVIVNPPAAGGKPRRIVFCSGRIAYDLLESIQGGEGTDCMIVRIEQLYPLPAAEIAKILSENHSADCVWLQEEPRNLGPWSWVLDRFGELFDLSGDPRRLRYEGRPVSASPAVGSKRVHMAEQAEICRRVLAPEPASGREERSVRVHLKVS